MEITLLIFIAGCGLITLVAMIMVVREGLLIRKLSHLTFSDLPVKKTIFCQLVLSWCHANLGNPNKSKPTLILKYYPHKKLAGVFIISSNECHIYIQNHQTLREITNTIIHEYVHSLQKSKTFVKMYEKQQREIGYDKNFFEVEARKISAKYERESLVWVYSQISKT